MDESLQKSSAAARFWPVLKWISVGIVMIFVGRRAIELWKSAPRESVSINGLWLIPAGLIYFVGWLPSVWFWRALLRAMRQPVSWSDAIRAYYVGNMGKYVPGKALVLVIRATILKESGVSAMLAGTTACYETLVFMATGTTLALALSAAFDEAFWTQLPWPLHGFHGHPYLIFLTVIFAEFVTTPFSAWLFTQVGRKSMARNSSDAGPAPAISAALMCQGIVATSLGWACHALSLGCVLQSVSSRPIEFAQFPIWLEACTTSVVGGFVILIAPGGIGVREGLLIETLKDQPHIGPTTAILAAGLLRAVWFAAELVAAGVLYFTRKRSLRGSNQPGSDGLHGSQ